MACSRLYGSKLAPVSCVPVQAPEVKVSDAYGVLADVYSLTVMISEMITLQMMSPPRYFGPEEVPKMAAAAAAYMDALCPAMARLLRAGISRMPAERPSAFEMLTVLNSDEVIAACAAAAAAVRAPAVVS